MPIPENITPGCPPGLEYLTQIDQLLVHQQIEIFESMLQTLEIKYCIYYIMWLNTSTVVLYVSTVVTNFETENKYRIRNTLGQQVYFAKERKFVLVTQLNLMLCA